MGEEWVALIGKNEWRGIDNGEIKLYICGWRCQKMKKEDKQGHECGKDK